MKSLMLALLNVFTFVSCSTPRGPITQPMLGGDPYEGLNLPQNAYGATVLAYLYSSPLYVYAASLANGSLTKYGVNKFRAYKGLHDASFFAPLSNVDTVYGSAFMDLSAEDLILTIPPMQNNRYYSFSFFDPYSDDFAVIGTLNNDPSGKYLVRPSIKTGKAGLTTENCDGYVGCVDSPTLDIYFLARVLAIPNNQTDIIYVNKYLKGVKLASTNKHNPTAPALMQKDFDGLSNNLVMQALQLMARLGNRNPPQDTLLATFMPFVLLSAGVSNGKYTPVKSVNLSQVQDAWDNITSAFTASPVNIIPLNNGWTVSSPVWSGSFQNGTNIVSRAFTAQHGYAQNIAAESIYPTAPQDLYTLSEGEAYIVSFSGKPPINTRVGFWSLTMYDSSRRFVSNPQNIYALGDRSNMTYPDGTPIYRGGDPKTDKPFQMLIQASDQQPPRNWSNNWLPSPTGGAPFHVLLRLYAPDLSTAEDGSYEYPIFTKQSVITSR